MTIEYDKDNDNEDVYFDERFRNVLEISRNKVLIHLSNYLDAVADSIVSETKTVPSYCRDAKKFDLYLSLFLEIYSNVHDGVIKTKRDIFYSNPGLYKRQSVVDAAIDNLSKHLSVPRDALNVIGSGKGLFYAGDGCKELIKINGKIQNSGITLIPSREEIRSFRLFDDVLFVLVIEKEAVMNVVVQGYAYLKEKLGGSFLIISGKGYPCLRTKQFLNLIHSKYPKIPKYILVDNDPYGIDISINYNRSTSSNMDMDECKLDYIGVTHLDVDEFGDSSKYQLISPADLKRLESIERKAKAAAGLFQAQQEEIKFMRNNLKKYEIECLYLNDNDNNATFDNTKSGSDGFCKRFLYNKLQGLLASRTGQED